MAAPKVALPRVSANRHVAPPLAPCSPPGAHPSGVLNGDSLTALLDLPPRQRAAALARAPRRALRAALRAATSDR